jgi:hypothetical protein
MTVPRNNALFFQADADEPESFSVKGVGVEVQLVYFFGNSRFITGRLSVNAYFYPQSHFQISFSTVTFILVLAFTYVPGVPFRLKRLRTGWVGSSWYESREVAAIGVRLQHEDCIVSFGACPQKPIFLSPAFRGASLYLSKYISPRDALPSRLLPPLCYSLPLTTTLPSTLVFYPIMMSNTMSYITLCTDNHAYPKIV